MIEKRVSRKLGKWVSVVGYRLSVIGYWLLVIGYRLSVIGYLLVIIAKGKKKGALVPAWAGRAPPFFE
jgi:hypothetical protein